MLVQANEPCFTSAISVVSIIGLHPPGQFKYQMPANASFDSRGLSLSNLSTTIQANEEYANSNGTEKAVSDM